MKILHKILTIALLIPTLYVVFWFGGIVSIVEGYNIFNPYIDTEFTTNYSPEKFNSISMEDSKKDVLLKLGEPLFIFNDSINNKEWFVYTSDGYLKRKSNRNYHIDDFAWYCSNIIFDSNEQIMQINKGWCYD